MHKRTILLTSSTLAAIAAALALLWLLGGVRMPGPQVAHAAGPHHVAPGGNCGAASPCYATLQAAVDAADDGDVIKVAQGDYTDVHARDGITQVVYISKTVTIQGGYTTTNWTTSFPITQPTILDAQKMGRGLVITGAITATVEGLHITGGDATGLGGWQWGNAGGGLYIIYAKATVNNCVIYSNTAGIGGDDVGGGLYLYSSDIVLNGNTVLSNAAGGAGGMFLYYSNVTLNGNTVTANTSSYNGGGVFLYYNDVATLSGNIVISNTAGSHGGGLFLYESDAALINNVVAGNQADRTGSGLHIRGSSPWLLHTTIARNRGGDGSGVYVDHWFGPYSSVAMTNTIITGHTVGITVTAGNAATLNGTLWHANTITQSGNVSHTNDHSGDPAFASDGYHLRANSAAIDQGIASVDGVATDIDGDARPVGPLPDLGADEWLPRIYLPLVMRGG